MCVCSVMFDSVIPWTVACQAPHPWNFPSKNTGKGCHFLLQGIFPTPGIEPMSLVSPALQVDSLLLGHWFYILHTHTQTHKIGDFNTPEFLPSPSPFPATHTQTHTHTYTHSVSLGLQKATAQTWQIFPKKQFY